MIHQLRLIHDLRGGGAVCVSVVARRRRRRRHRRRRRRWRHRRRRRGRGLVLGDLLVDLGQDLLRLRPLADRSAARRAGSADTSRARSAEVVELAIALAEVEQELRPRRQLIAGGELAQRLGVIAELVERATRFEVRARARHVIVALRLRTPGTGEHRDDERDVAQTGHRTEHFTTDAVQASSAIRRRSLVTFRPVASDGAPIPTPPTAVDARGASARPRHAPHRARPAAAGVGAGHRRPRSVRRRRPARRRARGLAARLPRRRHGHRADRAGLGHVLVDASDRSRRWCPIRSRGSSTTSRSAASRSACSPIRRWRPRWRARSSGWPRTRCPIVVDPVLRATRGIPLLEGNAMQALAPLLALATVVTPNLDELATLTGRPRRARRRRDARAGAAAASSSARARCWPRAATSTATSSTCSSTTTATPPSAAQRIEGVTPHGTGCALSSEIACRLAFGTPLREAVIGACNRVRAAHRRSPRRRPRPPVPRALSDADQSGRRSSSPRSEIITR